MKNFRETDLRYFKPLSYLKKKHLKYLSIRAKLEGSMVTEKS